jgi:hypothetical protein
MWDLSITISSSEGAGAAALESTRHLETSLAAIRPSCSKEDKVPSSRLQGSPATSRSFGHSGFRVWWPCWVLSSFRRCGLMRWFWIHGGKGCSGNNVQDLKRRGRRSQLVAEKWPAAKSSRRWLVGDRGALAVVLKREREREYAGENKVWTGWGWAAGVYIGPEPRYSCPPSGSFILIAKTLDRLHVSKGKTLTSINSTYAVNLALEGTTCRKLRRILWYDPTDPRNPVELKLRRIIRYLRRIEMKKRGTSRTAIQTQRENELWRMDFTKNKA